MSGKEIGEMDLRHQCNKSDDISDTGLDMTVEEIHDPIITSLHCNIKAEPVDDSDDADNDGKLRANDDNFFYSACYSLKMDPKNCIKKEKIDTENSFLNNENIIEHYDHSIDYDEEHKAMSHYHARSEKLNKSDNTSMTIRRKSNMVGHRRLHEVSEIVSETERTGSDHATNSQIEQSVVFSHSDNLCSANLIHSECEIVLSTTVENDENGVSFSLQNEIGGGSTFSVKEEPENNDDDDDDECSNLTVSSMKKGFDLKIHSDDKHYYTGDVREKSMGDNALVRVIDDEKPYECDICLQTFNLKSNMVRHRRLHSDTDEKPHKCDLCGKSFTTKTNMSAHRRIHTGEKPYNCDTCELKFNRKDDMMKHRRVHTGEKPYKCDMCENTFRRKSTMLSHRRIHTGEKPYKCDFCQQAFSQKANMFSHRRIHTGEKPFECDICKQSFNKKSIMAIHRQRHTGEKPYECDLCSQTFTLKYWMIAHRRLHTDEKPYKCDDCELSFRTKNDKVAHERLHTGEGPYQCDLCQQTFKHKRNLVEHYRIHTGEKPYICEVCDRSFNRKSSMIRHQRIHAAENTADGTNILSYEHAIDYSLGAMIGENESLEIK